MLRLVSSSLVSFLLVTMLALDAAENLKTNSNTVLKTFRWPSPRTLGNGIVAFSSRQIAKVAIVWLTTEGTYYQFFRKRDTGQHDESGRNRRRSIESVESGRDTIEQIAVKTTLVGSTASTRVVAQGESGFKSNFFIGNDPGKWRTNVPSYSSVIVKDVYPRIDLKYYSTSDGKLEYDFFSPSGSRLSAD